MDMKLVQYFKKPEGLYLETTQGSIKLTVCSSRVLRIQYTLEAEFSKNKSLMIASSFTPEHDLYTVTESDFELVISTSELYVIINKKTCSFAYFNSEGVLLTKEPDRGGKTLDPVDVVLSVFEDSEVESGHSVDGLRISADNVKKVVDRQAYRTKLEFEWMDGEALYGLGSHEEGMLNLRGQHQFLYQENMKATVPVLMSTQGYGILLDSYSFITFRDDAFGSYLWTDVDAEMDYYFIYGPEMDEIVQGIRKLTGKAPMLPKWAYGYIQSKERYVSQEELIEVVSEYRKRKIPLDCIVLDWKSWTGELWGQKTFDPERFPDPDTMTKELHRMNARLMVSIWPIMAMESDNNKEMAENGCLLGNQGNYNPFLEKGRSLYWKQTNEGLFSHDVDAWWCDCSEPFEADWNGKVKQEPEERMLINTQEAKKYLDPEYINAYSLLHSKGIYEGQRATTNSKRVVNLTRSSYAGQHRYATITWSGDIAANWDTLTKQVADGLNFCATGSPYWTLDIGAFFVKNNGTQWFWSGDYDQGVEDWGYRELYTRWFQYGAFLPMFRSHGTDTPREVWRFGAPGEPMYDALIRALELRYQLMPYIYSLAAKIHFEDYTLMRALPFDFRQDPNTFDIKDQFMFGSAMLINPVTQPMYYGPESTVLEGVEKSRNVYLPSGYNWFDFWTNEVHAGGQYIVAKATIDRIPIFVKSGSIIPMGATVQYADEVSGQPLILRIYSGSDASFLYYEDEGDSYNYEQGHYASIPMEWNEAARTLLLSDREGVYAGMSTNKQINVQLVDLGNADTDKFVVSRTVSYTGDALILKF